MLCSMGKIDSNAVAARTNANPGELMLNGCSLPPFNPWAEEYRVGGLALLHRVNRRGVFKSATKHKLAQDWRMSQNQPQVNVNLP